LWYSQTICNASIDFSQLLLVGRIKAVVAVGTTCLLAYFHNERRVLVVRKALATCTEGQA
jgi:hypothetical protein